jgi:hypothetical protein
VSRIRLWAMHVMLSTACCFAPCCRRYGDFSPATTIGRLFVICVVLYGIIIFATQITKLQDAVEVRARIVCLSPLTGTVVYCQPVANVLQSDRKGRGRYDPRIMGPHIVVVGDPSVSQVQPLCVCTFPRWSFGGTCLPASFSFRFVSS